MEETESSERALVWSFVEAETGYWRGWKRRSFLIPELLQKMRHTTQFSMLLITTLGGVGVCEGLKSRRYSCITHPVFLLLLLPIQKTRVFLIPTSPTASLLELTIFLSDPLAFQYPLGLHLTLRSHSWFLLNRYVSSCQFPPPPNTK